MLRTPATTIRPSVRYFCYSPACQARKTVRQVLESRAALRFPPGYKEPTPDEVREMLFRESERVFGPDIGADPAAHASQLADDVWKNAFKSSGNDRRILEAWREDVKTRATSLDDSETLTPKTGGSKRH